MMAGKKTSKTKDVTPKPSMDNSVNEDLKKEVNEDPDLLEAAKRLASLGISMTPKPKDKKEK